MVLSILALHAVAAILAPWLVHRLGTRAFFVLALAPIVTLVWLSAAAQPAYDGGALDEVVRWIPALNLELAFRTDLLALVMIILVAGIGTIVLIYCERYFSAIDGAVGRTAGVLVAFAGAMVGLVLADDLIMVYVFWELTTVFSYLLIGHDTRKIVNRQAAMRALIVTTFGGLAMLVGLVLLGELAGTYRLSAILADPPVGGATLSLALVLILAGALSKSALFPFSFWLPGAMAAPTPVSAYLHAAAMVKAGVYLIARLAPAFSGDPVWRPIVLVLGLATMLMGARRALQQYDLKLLLAYGTVSQLGFLVVLVGAGTRDAALAGITALLAHAFFKSTLFLVVGIIDHKCGTRDLRKLTGLTERMRWVAVVTVIALASMAGLPPMIGFVAKEAAFESFWGGSWIDWLVLAGLVVGSALTLAYSARFFWGAFWSKAEVPNREVRRVGPAFLATPVLLAACCVLLGVAASWLDPLLAHYADQFTTSHKPYHLALWHGLTPALGLTALVILAGLGLSRFQHRAYTAADSYTLFGESERTYRHTAQLVDWLALLLTSATQRGSLPAFLATMLVTLVALPGTSLAMGGFWPGDFRLWDHPAQLGIAALMAIAAVLACRTHHRLHAALLVGVTGYGTAALFVLHGAPDLALTQFLVETVALVVFVLVLRRLPVRYSGNAQRGRRVWRIGLALAVGVLASCLAMVAIAARSETPISEGFAAAAEKAGGHNIVNLTLVDMRAWDTMGEISVLVTVAIGVASLVFVRRRQSALTDASEAGSTGRVWAHRTTVETAEPDEGPDLTQEPSWLPGGHTLAPERRSMLIEVVTRMTFHVMIMFSIFLMLAGHDMPGGGFAGGLVAGLALVVRYLAGGRYELGETLKLDARVPLGLGLVVAVGTGVVAMLSGGAVLQSGILALDLPLLGTIKLYSSTAFDVGVYLVVVGLILEILTSLGAQVDRQEEREHERPPAQAGDRPDETREGAGAR